MGRKIIDLSQPIHNDMVVFPGHIKTVLWKHTTHEERRKKNWDITYETWGLLMCDHGPTHVDAHRHLNPDAEPIDQIPLENFFTEAVCLDFSHLKGDEVITAKDLEEACKRHGLEIKKGDTVLIYTGTYERLGKTLEYAYRSPGLSGDAMEWLADKGIVNVGIDSTTIESTANSLKGKFPAHLVCKNRKIMNTENLCNLGAVAGKRFTFIAFPLRIVGGSGSPLRAVAVIEE